MPLQSEIVQRLSADNSNYRSVMNQSELVADKTGKSIMKKLDIKAGTTAIATAIGLNIQSIAEGIARTITGLSKEAEDAIQKLEQASERSAAAVQKSLDMRKTVLQQIADLQRDVARSQNAMNDAKNATPSKSFSLMGIPIGRGSAFDKIFGFSRKEDEGNRVKMANAEAEIKEKSYEIEVKTKALQDDNLEQIVRNENLRADYVKANREQVELEAKALSGRILPAEKLRLDILQLQGKQREKDQQIENILAKFPEERSQKEKEQLVTLQRQKEVLDKQITAKQELIVSTNSQVKVEEKVGEEIGFALGKLKSFVDEWTGFSMKIESKGRGDKELSDRELERKISNINQDISARTAALQGSWGGPTALSRPTDLFLEAQRSNLQQTQTELDFRRQVRQVASSQGDDAALSMYSGLTEQRLREIKQTLSSLTDVVAEQKETNALLRGTLRTASQPNPTDT